MEAFFRVPCALRDDTLFDSGDDAGRGRSGRFAQRS